MAGTTLQHSNTPSLHHSRVFVPMRHPSLLPLSHDHHHGLALALRCRKQALGQIKPMGAAGLRERAVEVLAFYDNNLRAHFRAEEEILFPNLRSLAPQSRTLVESLSGEHERIRGAIEQIKSGAALAKVIFDLGDLLEQHIRKEERELFPLFEQQVDATRAEAIGVEIERILKRS
jgi:iron-sulfur cluster repair protein YtfE (RIC family)